MKKEEKLKLVPICKRVLISVEEAAAYTSIGVKKLRKMTKDPDCSYVLWIGTKRMLKRRMFDEYLQNSYYI